jgi:hypothetical protein
VSRLRRPALAACGLLALVGCQVDITVHVRVDDDGSGTVTVTAVADAAVVEQAPGLAEDLQFADALTAGWTVDGPTATDAGGLQVVITHDFATPAEATALLQSINGVGGPLHDISITRTETDSQITTFLTGTLRVDSDLQAYADSELLNAIGGSPYVDLIRDQGLQPNEAVSFSLSADLPGDPITEGSPTEWVAPADGTSLEVISTAALAQGSTGIWPTVSTVALVALIGWCLVAIAFIVFVAKARRRRARAAASGFRPRPLKHR